MAGKPGDEQPVGRQEREGHAELYAEIAGGEREPSDGRAGEGDTEEKGSIDQGRGGRAEERGLPPTLATEAVEDGDVEELGDDECGAGSHGDAQWGEDGG